MTSYTDRYDPERHNWVGEARSFITATSAGVGQPQGIGASGIFQTGVHASRGREFAFVLSLWQKGGVVKNKKDSGGGGGGKTTAASCHSKMQLQAFLHPADGGAGRSLLLLHSLFISDPHLKLTVVLVFRGMEALKY